MQVIPFAERGDARKMIATGIAHPQRRGVKMKDFALFSASHEGVTGEVTYRVLSVTVRI
jgi:hypothetical protein